MPGWKKNIPACLQPDPEGGELTARALVITAAICRAACLTRSRWSGLLISESWYLTRRGACPRGARARAEVIFLSSRRTGVRSRAVTGDRLPTG